MKITEEIHNKISGHKTFGVKCLFEPSTVHKLLATVDINAARTFRFFKLQVC